MIEAYVSVCEALNDVSLFDNDVVVTGLKYAWKEFGLSAHIIQMLIYSVFVILLMTSTYLFQYYSVALPRVALGIQIAVLVLVFYFIVEEVLEIYAKSHYTHHTSDKIKSASKSRVLNSIFLLLLNIKMVCGVTINHFTIAWNFLDLIIYGLVTTGTAFRIVQWTETPTTTSCLAVAILFVWIRSLYFLRPFQKTGPLISMILHIMKTIVPFLCVLFMILIGFTSAFYLLSQDGEDLPFGTVKGAFLSAFDYMLGNFDSDFSGTSNPQLATVLYVGYLLFALVVMFNLLIAIMGNAYNEVQVKGLSEWRKEQATILIDLKRKLPTRYLNAVSDTYEKTKNKNFQWYQQDKAEDSKGWFKSKSSTQKKTGEGCYLYILKRRVDYEASNKDVVTDSSNSNNSTSSTLVDEKIKTLEAKIDDVLKALSSMNTTKK